MVLASAVVPKPKVLLLDKPTADLDYELKKVFIDIALDLVKNHGVSLVMATHNVEVLHMLTGFRVVLMNKGSVCFSGSIDEVLNNPEVFEPPGLLPPTIANISRKLGVSYELLARVFEEYCGRR